MKWFLLVLLMVFGCVEVCSAHHGAAAARANARAARANARAAANFHHAQAQFQFAAPVYQYQVPVVLQAAPVYVPQQQFQFQQQYAPQRAVGGCGAALFGY